MIFAEVGLNHNGSKSYAQEYVNFHKKADFDILTFQIREPDFYKRKEKRHLKLPKYFYYNLSKIYKKKNLEIAEYHFHRLKYLMK